VIGVDGSRVALTTDAFVVRPLRFPGGSIGELAVNGTINDLAAAGARPLALSAALVVEEELDAEALQAEVEAMATTARRAEVAIVAGDTKVVERGKADGLYITSTGIRLVAPDVDLGPECVRTGDRVLVSGPLGDQGVAIMLARGELDIAADVASDTRPLWPLAAALLVACDDRLHCLRDATRGGVATVLPTRPS
jgi:hydrogenase expression/formation protein HypE